MSEYRFHLQKYRPGSKTTCPSCGKSRCFVRYIDEQGSISFPGNVGKCDHENSCGYHYTPKEYFKDNPDVLEMDEGRGKALFSAPYKTADKIPSCIAPSYIPSSYVLRSLSHYSINPLYQYFCHVFGENEASRLFEMYRIGTSSKWGGATVFWQTDINGQVRTGKVMCYNAETGYRVKEPQAFVSWAHSELKLQDFHLKQCLFGEHLLKNSSSPVMLVESEKTAVVMSHFIPDYIWLATGGKNGCFNSEAMQVLKGREVTLIPDLGATEQWKEKSALLSGICKRVVVSNVLECTSDEEQRSQGLDIADFFLYSGLDRVLWLDSGHIIGDDTDSHIDTLARFCSEDTIAYVSCDNINDPQYEEFSSLMLQLQSFRTPDGKPYRLVPLPFADEMYLDDYRLPATYANFLIINGAVLLPGSGSPKDEIARKALQEVFPDREVIVINCTALLSGHGSLHCITMQYPEGYLNI